MTWEQVCPWQGLLVGEGVAVAVTVTVEVIVFCLVSYMEERGSGHLRELEP